MAGHMVSSMLSFRGERDLRGRGHSVLTLSLLMEGLKRFELLNSPRAHGRRFTWSAALVNQLDIESFKPFDSHVLYVCNDDMARVVLDASNATFVLLVTPGAELPEWALPMRNRILAVRSDEHVLYVASVVGNLFTNMLLWEERLDRIVAERGTMAQLLNEGAVALGGFSAITDAGFNLVARTMYDPPEGELAALVDTGCYSAKAIEHLERNVLGKRAENALVSDDAPVIAASGAMHYLVFFERTLFFHLVVPKDPEASEEALSDLIGIFARRFEALCLSLWDDHLRVDAPWHKVLNNYLMGEEMTDAYMQVQLKQTRIPDASSFKLYCIDLSKVESSASRSEVIAAAPLLGGGEAYPLVSGGYLLVLCCYESGAHHDEVSMRDDEIFDDLSTRCKIRVGESRPFERLSDLRVAYMQTRIASHFAPIIERAYEFSGSGRRVLRVPFDLVLPYYLISSACRDNPLVGATVRGGLLECLSREDREQGTEYVRLLWTYLCCERNATAAAKQLYTHRNTVLYRIDKIERDHGVNLDDVVVRNLLLEEFRMYFLTDGFTRDIDYNALLEVRLPEDDGIR